MHVRRLLPVFFVALLPVVACGQLLQVEDTRIVDSSNGEEVILNAVNFGNWMVMEGYMMNSVSQAPDQHTWKQKLTTLVGSNGVKTFYDAWLANHVTQADINQIKAWGFNAVRLPLHYEYFVNLGTPDVWNNQGFALLDNIISWCTAAGIYVILDLHAAPGGQSDNSGISDYDSTKPSLWESAENRSKTVRLWDRLSERYKNEEWVAGYDLINEPNWNLPNGTLLRELYEELTRVIRANGDNHILFIEGNSYSNDYTGLTPAWDSQMVYVFHKYQSSADFASDLQWVLDLRAAENRPIWCGEHGENSNDNFTKMVELLRGQGIGMSWWPMKKFGSINCLASATFPPGYQDLLDYLGGSNPNLNPRTARNILAQLAESVRLANTQTRAEVLRAIFVQPGNRGTAPFGPVPTIPGTVYASDYDQGMNGHAYADTGWENVLYTTGDYTAWNERWTYRNGGVDIETCSDPQSNGYNVCFFQPTEWMKYTVDVASPGTYAIDLRVANGSGQTATLEIQNGDGTKTLAVASVPNGSWSDWVTVSVSGGFSEAGPQSIRIANTGASDCNINSVRLTKTGDEVAAATAVPVTVTTVSLKANNGGYLSWKSASPHVLTCEATSETDNTQFTLVDAGAGRTALLAGNGKYVRYSEADKKLYADADSLGPDEQFTLNRLNRSVAIQAPNSLYVSQNADNPVLCDKSVIAGWEYFLMTSLSTTQGPPAAPLGVSVNNGTISWRTMLGATHYSVERRTSSGDSFQTIATDLAGASFTDPSPVSGATNTYRVISHAGTYTSPPSAEVDLLSVALPAGWTGQDIGSVGVPGRAAFLNGSFALQGSGADIWETADGCHFVSRSVGGDFVMTARLASVSNTHYWAKAGMMVRESNAAGSRNVALLVTPEGGGTRMQWRHATDGDTSDHQLSGSNAPLWLRIVRSGNTFTGWQSDDGLTWTNTHAVTLAMTSTILIGLTVTSHRNDVLNTAAFDKVSVTGLAPGTSSWNAYQSIWFAAGQPDNSPEADANADGLANLFAYGAGLSPWTQAKSENGGLPFFGSDNGCLAITYTRLRNRFDFDYVVEVSGDLVTWNSGPDFTVETIVVPLDDLREQVTVRDALPTSAANRRFIRLRGIYPR